MYIHSLEKNKTHLNTKVFCDIFTHLRHLTKTVPELIIITLNQLFFWMLYHSLF